MNETPDSGSTEELNFEGRYLMEQRLTVENLVERLAAGMQASTDEALQFLLNIGVLIDTELPVEIGPSFDEAFKFAENNIGTNGKKALHSVKRFGPMSLRREEQFEGLGEAARLLKAEHYWRFHQFGPASAKALKEIYEHYNLPMTEIERYLRRED